MFGICIETGIAPAKFDVKGFDGVDLETVKTQFFEAQLGFKGVDIEVDYYGFVTKSVHK